MYWSSPETDKLDAAILAIQAEMAPVEKSSDNPFFKSKYADLSAIHAAVQPLLTKHKVTVMQPLSGGDGRTLGVMTRLACDGQWFMTESIMPLVTDKDGKSDPQKYGSAATYARRYALCAALNIIVVDEDDDGNAASTPPRREAAPPPTRALNKAEQTVVASVRASIDLAKTAADVVRTMKENGAYLETLPDKGEEVRKYGAEIFTKLKRTESGQGER